MVFNVWQIKFHQILFSIQKGLSIFPTEQNSIKIRKQNESFKCKIWYANPYTIDVENVFFRKRFVQIYKLHDFRYSVHQFYRCHSNTLLEFKPNKPIA